MKYVVNMLFTACLLVGIVGRFMGGWINTQSNDDHVEVVLRILQNQDVSKDSCWECFQPKMYYRTHAFMANFLGNDSRVGVNRQMQLGNVFFSFLGIWWCFLFLKQRSLSRSKLKLLMGFILVLPVLFGMSIQNTNDLVIFTLSSGAILFLDRYSVSHSLLSAFMVLLIIGLAYMVKGSGLAVFLMIGTLLVAQSIKIRSWLPIAGFSLLIGHLIFFSHYRSNANQYGDPFVTNIGKTFPPSFFNDSLDFYARPGIVSVFDSYGKFQFMDLIEHPYNVNSEEYTPHRTSFWAQLYGSFLDTMFLQHPYYWQNRNEVRLTISRAIFILGLWPLSLFILGFLSTLRTGIAKPMSLVSDVRVWGMLLVAGILIFDMRYAYTYRDYGCIKAHFIVPMLIPIILLVLEGWKVVQKTRWHNLVRFGLLVFLPLLIYNSAYLIHQLIRISNGSLTFP
ncbi:MAG: hypothetical protein KDC76_11640 [Bacteroidetes bacterium]|nr:hypothetical protein [Bacteroidota bacterium]